MRTFRDRNGLEWVVDLTAWHAKRLRDIGVDLSDVKSAITALQDVVRLVDCLWIVVEQEAKDRGVTDEQFGRSLGGDSLDAATRALLRSLADFAGGRRSEAMHSILDKTEQAESSALDGAVARIAAMDAAELAGQMIGDIDG